MPAGPGRGSEALPESRSRFKAGGSSPQAMAMGGAYAAPDAARAILRFDRFHVLKVRNKRFDDLRSELLRRAQDQSGNETIKGSANRRLVRSRHSEKESAPTTATQLDFRNQIDVHFISHINY